MYTIHGLLIPGMSGFIGDLTAEQQDVVLNPTCNLDHICSNCIDVIEAFNNSEYAYDIISKFDEITLWSGFKLKYVMIPQSWSAPIVSKVIETHVEKMQNAKSDLDFAKRNLHSEPPTNLQREILKDNDPVNHPSHYTSHPSGVECIDVTRWMNFNLGNAVKYIWRAGLKDPSLTLQDLEKAEFYIRDEIKRIKGEIENGENKSRTSNSRYTGG